MPVSFVEPLQRRGIDVVGPVVDIQHAILGAGRQSQHQQGKQRRRPAAINVDPGGTNAACVPPSTGIVVPVT